MVTYNLPIKAVPAYQIISPRQDKGRSNGYLIWFDSKQIYLAGSIKIIPEMDAIKELTAAILGFSKYNMDEEIFVETIEKWQNRYLFSYLERRLYYIQNLQEGIYFLEVKPFTPIVSLSNKLRNQSHSTNQHFNIRGSFHYQPIIFSCNDSTPR